MMADLFGCVKRSPWFGWFGVALGMLALSHTAVMAQATAQLKAADLYEKKVFRDADCLILKGGTAPLNRLTRMQGGLAVTNLNLTYLGKPLHKLNANDFRILPELLMQCEKIDAEVANYQAERLQILVEDARTSHDSSLAWFADVKTEVAKMTGTAADIRRVHDLETELQSRNMEMTRADMRRMVDWLGEQRDLLYQKPRKGPEINGVGLFNPGPTLPPDSPD